ncbi:FAD binding domain-containing protein [Dactylonectria macrodidyma]|uniref:FAD binding domain-containing protein n=1 Tax=Dactylonectria macrodidyma TaxID=307937 RepID=A0A9P9F5Q0_9HYPO|nr:FAD binding domain-containing protein [Dactylonectria macrodidyma]
MAVKSKGLGADGVAAPNSTGIKVIIVGMGLGGLAAAIECTRKGHTVLAIDQQKELKPIGDSIAVPSNAANVVRKWANGAVDERLSKVVTYCEIMEMHNSKGELIINSNLGGYSGGKGKGHGYPAHRGDLAMAFYDHAKDLGVEFMLGHRVLEYFEDENEAGVVIDGQKITADCVIGADGIHSKARGAITGTNPAPHSSGYAMYRAWFDADEVAADPETRWIMEGSHINDISKLYFSTDLHLMLGTAKRGKEIFWMCTHKDTYDVAESWSFPGKLEDMLEYIKDWPITPKLEKVFRKTPKDRLIDFKLLWRDALKTWVSPHGRMMLIGDAAHAILPTSGQGAGQAIEDAATLAVCLELGGKGNIQQALRATQALRYDRASLMQRIGIETRDAWHKTDWEAVAKDARILEMPRPKWIFGHDCQQYAYDEYDKAVEALNSGVAYKACNVPSEGENHRQLDFLDE